MSSYDSQKAFPLVIRNTGAVTELLIFDHPLTPPQVAKGTIDPGENPLAAAKRELVEESGLSSLPLLGDLGTTIVDSHKKAANTKFGIERQRWHMFLFEASADVPDRWNQNPVGSEEEERLVFVFRWVPLNDAMQHLHPHFEPAVEAVQRWLADNR